ncbi:hypothetical protein [Candidatus Rhodobacter oscarellae]|nr:hypothetical protein [Candidatus Rhodobacter lobularis]
MTKSAEIWLMVDPVGDQVAPVSTRAFKTVTAPVSRVLARNCVALFLDPEGRVHRIEAIHPQRPGPLCMLRLWLGQATPARFVFEPVDAPLDDIRTMVLDAMMYSRKNGAKLRADWWLFTASEAQVRTQLATAQSLAELHAMMRFPAEENCLDLL